MRIREGLHGSLIANDELDICGGIITNKINGKIKDIDHPLVIPPTFSGLFDSLYRKGGLGFKEEKNMKYKTDDRYYILGS
ncbi:hypothetical protein AAE02nite_43460 [Adhaeribacter aerolatus]|uniref:Uncharacterized protein n=1 Tax=Adhaeribacter aerolatus TaxID=670289 RepID=A0A512B417_9BACT|nr:hypothetical protein AAE02nite_43460 [Adhaeribacter aerolatus]